MSSACPNCGGVNTLDQIDGRVYYCRDCEYSRAYDIEGALGRPPPRRPPPSTGPTLGSLQLLPLLTTPDREGEHAVLAPSTGGTRGGPRTGGPITPPRPQPVPAGIPRRRKPFVAVPAAALALLLLTPITPLVSAALTPPLPLHPASSSSGPTIQVSLSYLNWTSNSSVPVSQALANFLFINASWAVPIENFTLSDGWSYTLSNFSGMNLTDVDSILVYGDPPTAYPNATPALADLENVTGQTTIGLNLVWSNANSSISTPGIANGTLLFPPPPSFPLFLTLVGIGLFLALSSLVVGGLWKVVGASREEE
jgi:hypothetical protein